MKIKLSHKEIGLQRIAKVTQISSDVAKITMHTGESIHVRCGVEYPVRGAISYPGTFQELKAMINTYKRLRAADKVADC